MADIFFSYTRKDKDRVRPIVQLLQSEGWSVWWDSHIAPGVDFDQETARELESARCVVVAWSSESVNSRWVRGEARVGANRGIVVPLLIDAIEPPIDFRAIQCIDVATGITSEDARALLAAVGDILARGGAERTLRRTPVLNRVRRRQLILGSGVAGVAAVLGANSQRVADLLSIGLQMPAALVGNVLLDGKLRAALEARREALRNAVRPEFVPESQRQIRDAWGMAQIATALPNQAIDEAVFEQFFTESYSRSCACWAPVDGGEHLVSTAWVIMAHASRQVQIRREVLRAILDRQGDTGGWPMYFDAERRDEFDSAYTTAIVTLTLDEYRGAGLDPDMHRLLTDSVDLAVRWLYAHAPPEGELWKDYPEGRDRVLRSRGVSAIAVFTLLTLAPDDDRKTTIARAWQRTLDQPLQFETLESADQFIRLEGNRFRRDGTRYIVTCWELAALITAYPFLSEFEQARARRFVDMVLDMWQPSQIIQYPFIAAESVYALGLVLDEN